MTGETKMKAHVSAAHPMIPGLFLTAALTGGTLFILQMLLSAVGSADTDVDGDADLGGHPDAHFAGLFSFRSVTAALTVFGLSGQVVRAFGGNDLLALALAFVLGVATMGVVAVSVKALLKLADNGTFRVEQSVGSHGVVYVGIPAPGDGLGKVHLTVQGRTVELEAASADKPLATGTPVVVTAVLGPNTVEVVHNF